jgi:3-dehydroquinate synthase
MNEAGERHDRLRVDLGARGYDILVGEDLVATAGRHLAGLLAQPRAVVVTDGNVAAHWLEPLGRTLAGAGIAHDAVVLEAGERSKDYAHLERLLDRLLDLRVERRTSLVALGGGVVGDLAGFAAAIALRGLDLVQVPTSLLAQVDSSVGGKTGINTRHGKNLIGAFHQPRLVLADVGTLDTLPPRELRAGYAEVVKYALIGDAPFFSWLAANGRDLLAGDRRKRRHAVLVCCRAKATIVGADEREAGPRALLNLGHTFGHALESLTGYGDALLHGEAVAIGLALAFAFSARLGLCADEDADRVRRHLEAAGLPSSPAGLPGGRRSPDEVLSRMEQDKKVVGGEPTLILARGIGQAFVARGVERRKLRAFLADALSG